MGGFYFLNYMPKKKIDIEKVKFLEDKGKEYSKDLIKKATKWELLFLEKLKTTNFKFIFQYPIVCNYTKLYIIDFYFPDLKLAIELDGSQHYTKKGVKYDKSRTSVIKKEGIKVLRIINKQVDLITNIHIKDLLSSYVIRSK